MQTSASNRKIICLALALLAMSLGIAARIGRFGAERHYTGFAKLTWEKSENCRVEESKFGKYENLRRISTGPGRGNTAHCISHWVPLQGHALEVEFAGYRMQRKIEKLQILVETRSGQYLKPIVTPFMERTGKLHLAQRSVEGIDAGDAIRLHVIDQDSDYGWITLREKVDFYNSGAAVTVLAKQLEHRAAHLFVQGLSAALILLACAMYLYLPAAGSVFSIFFFAALAGCVHFEPNLFFYGDDVMFISHYLEQGIAGFLRSHNEHVLPVFFALFVLEYFAFLGNYDLYLLLSLVIQGLNCVLFLKLCRELFPQENIWRIAAVCAAAFYALHGLHVEVLQWATCQSILLAVTFRLTGYLCALRYLQSGKYSDLVFSAVSALCSMFCYGGGILTPLEILLIPFIAVKASGEHVPRRNRLWFAMSLCLSVGGAMYTVYRNGIGYSVSALELPGIRDYLVFSLLGSQVGAVLRGTGLNVIPYRSIESFFPASWKFLVTLQVLPIMLGLIVNLLLFEVCRRKLGRRGVYIWIFSQVLVTCHFFMIGLGRTEWVGGPRYALSPRYHTEAMLGLALILVPALCLLLQSVAQISAPRIKPASAALIALAGVFIWQQFGTANSFEYYRGRANNNQRYVEQVGYWFRAGAANVSYLGNGTEYAGLYPIYHEHQKTWDIVPTHDPKQLYEMFQGQVAGHDSR